jgi:hypothetical protein
VDGLDVGTPETQFSADFVSSAAWDTPANYIAIVRHNNNQCDAVEVWKFKTAGVSMKDYFKADSFYQRAEVTGPSLYMVSNVNEPTDAILGNDGPLVFNWWHSNNGARIAHSKEHLSGAEVNDDDTHGLGNELGATTTSAGVANNAGSTEWWHDVAISQPDCHAGSCVVQVISL